MPSSALTAPSCIAPRPTERRVLLVQRDARRRTGAGTAAPCAASRRSTTGLPSSVKPSAPSSRSSAISVSSLALQAARDRGHEADGDARVARGGVAQRAQQRRGVDDRVGVRHRARRRRSRRRRRRGCRSRGPPCAPGRACAGARAGRRRPGSRWRPAAVDDLGAGGAVERAGRAELGDRAVADEDVVRRVDARARVEHVRVADEQVGGRARAPWTSGSAALTRAGARAHASTAPRLGAGAVARAPASSS